MQFIPDHSQFIKVDWKRVPQPASNFPLSEADSFFPQSQLWVRKHQEQQQLINNQQEHFWVPEYGHEGVHYVDEKGEEDQEETEREEFGSEGPSVQLEAPSSLNFILYCFIYFGLMFFVLDLWENKWMDDECERIIYVENVIRWLETNSSRKKMEKEHQQHYNLQ